MLKTALDKRKTISEERKTTSEMDRCIQYCFNTYRACESTLDFIQKRDDALTDVELVSVLKSCGEICLTSAKMMSMKSPFHAMVCRLCADICREAARLCLEVGDGWMDDLIEACSKSIESCDRMAKSVH